MRIRKTSQYIEGGTGLPSYFTDEIDTGMKWIDGKTIYRKVFTGTFLSNNDTVILTTSNNIDKIINQYGNINNIEGLNVPIGTAYYARTGELTRVVVTTTHNLALNAKQEFYANMNYQAVVEYTKTTD